jgi:hypothetical protein
MHGVPDLISARTNLARRSGHTRRGARAWITRAAVGALATALVLAACSSTSTTTTGAGSPADTVRSLGAVPIPSAPTAAPTPTADENHLQLLAIGEAVRADLPSGDITLTALGPQQITPSTSSAPPQQTQGVITVTASDATGSVTLAAADFTSRDERGNVLALTALGPTTATAAPGRPASLRLSGTFQSGAAQITWRHDMKVVAVWDFNVELD